MKNVGIPQSLIPSILVARRSAGRDQYGLGRGIQEVRGRVCVT